MRDATIMAASGVTMLVLFSVLSAANASRLNDIEEKVDIRNDLVSGKANYMPGAACVIATSAEQTPADIINYARACAKAHEDWLKEQQ
ncbi:MAG: hypothetical protein CMH39_00070 [Micrococcales bacterium]|nr:hypothetical protein [Micrococcales bacterium]